MEILAALLVIRCYAIYQRKLWVLLITIPLALAMVALSLVGCAFAIAEPAPAADAPYAFFSG